MSHFDPTEDQQTALKAILTWLKEKNGPFLTVGGYAGTGKTTLIALLREALSDEVKSI